MLELVTKVKSLVTPKEIFFLYIFYLLGIHLVISVAAANLYLSSEVHTLKELYFAVWGYGWDGWHYLTIATAGYRFPNQAFFPLYPLVLRFLDFFLPLTLAYRINLLLVYPLLLVLYRFGELLAIPSEKRINSLIGFLFFPTAFFLQANYSETLFILLSTLSLSNLLRGRFFQASGWALLASACRPTGLVLSPIIALSFLKRKGVLRLSVGCRWRERLEDLLYAFFWGFISSLGAVGYFIYLRLRFGSFRIFFRAQGEWYRASSALLPRLQGTLAESWRMVMIFVEGFPALPRETIDVFFLLFFLIVAVYFYRKMRWELYLFSVLVVLLPLLSGGTISIPRFILSAFPFLLLLGSRLEAPWKLSAYLLLGVSLQTLFVLMFLNNRFVA